VASLGQSVELSSTDTILEMIEGFWVSRAACVAAEFGVPDLLKSGPKEIEQLAERTGVHAPSLYRLMRALTSPGFFAEDNNRCFALTPLVGF